MIRRLVARLAARSRRRAKEPTTMEEWRAWQEGDFHERLRRIDPMP